MSVQVQGYRFAGDFIAQSQGNWDIQHKNHGMLELNIDRIVPGGKETLMLSLAEFELPGREVPAASLPYINGNNKYPTRPGELGPVSVTFRDFPKTNARAILHQWFRAVYDEETGLMGLPGAIKTTGYVVLFGADGAGVRSYLLEGVFPTKEPTISVAYDGGDVMLMAIELSIDRYIAQPDLFSPQ